LSFVSALCFVMLFTQKMIKLKEVNSWDF
jgi:hypothetical protein